ncbi:MAG: hypothetical protein A2Z16_04665 [Chloroflexi bacterium RBG_16_54_18]|nr:MAG: hypothetical protein A2Z16_04665 [Chloroflexi bacterium RBG_16_54_18]
MHPDEGEIRQFLDEEHTPTRQREIAAHLETCDRCRKISQAVSARIMLAEESLAETSFNPQSTGSARLELNQRLDSAEKENKFMFKKTFARIPRAAWVTLGVIGVLAIALSFPSVRAIATSFLGIFRVERVQVIPVDLENLPQAFGSGESFEKFMANEVQVEEFGEAKEVSTREEAGTAAGIPVRLPGNIEGEPRLRVEPGGRMTFQVNYELARAVLDDIGQHDIELPEGLDGAPIEVVIHPAVMAMYGECRVEEEIKAMEGMDPDESEAPPLSECTTLLQTTSPTISAPPGLDLGQIGEAYLQILGMTPQEAASFAANVDWTTTFVIPIPKYADYQQVLVDGVSGTLVEYRERGTAWYALLWVKDGLLYVLSGPGNGETAQGIAGSLE